MKSFLKWLFLMAGVLALSVVLAPILFEFLPFKFERIFNRLIMIFTITLAVWAVWTRQLSFPVESLRWKGFGWPAFVSAFAAGFITLLSVSFLKMGLGIVSFDFSLDSPAAWIQRISMSLLSALVIGIIEELFFRGFVFSTFQKKLAWPLLPCILATNVFYALIHFTGGKKMFIGPDPDFRDSLKLLAAPFQNLMEWHSVLPGAIGLFIFGVVLTLLFMRTGSLYPCIGLHAGCVFFLKMDGVFIRHEDRAPLWLFGGGQNYDGLLGWAAILILGVVLLRFYERKVIGGTGMRKLASVLMVCALSLLGPSSEAAAEEKSWASFSDEASSAENLPYAQEEEGFSPLSPATSSASVSSEVSQEPIVATVKTTAQSVERKTPSIPSAPKQTLKTPLVPETKSETTAKDLLSSNAQPRDFAASETVKPAVPKKAADKAKLTDEEGIKKETPVLKQESAEVLKAPANTKKKEEIIKELFPDAPVVEEETEDLSEARPMPKAAAGKAKKKKADVQPGSYLFAERLPEAEVFWISDAVGVLNGQWQADKFVFSEEAPGAEITSRLQVTPSGSDKPGISLRPSPEGMYRIRFPEVQAVSQLTLRYGFEGAADAAPPKAAVYIRVWLGTHALKRIRVFNEKGWKEESLDVGPAAFLKAPTVVTFEVTSDEPLDRNFNFFAEAG